MWSIPNQLCVSDRIASSNVCSNGVDWFPEKKGIRSLQEPECASNDLNSPLMESQTPTNVGFLEDFGQFMKSGLTSINFQEVLYSLPETLHNEDQSKCFENFRREMTASDLQGTSLQT